MHDAPEVAKRRRHLASYGLAVLLFLPFDPFAAKSQTRLPESGHDGAKYASAYNWMQSPTTPPALTAG